MTQNGLKWILNITLKTMKFLFPPSPPNGEKFDGFFFKASLITDNFKPISDCEMPIFPLTEPKAYPIRLPV